MAAVANGSDSRSPELVFVLLLVAGLAAQQKDRLAGPIDGRTMAVLASSRPPGLNRNRIGARSIRLSRSNQMTIAFKLSDSRQADLQRLLGNQQDRSSPNCHHWLSPSEYADRFGLGSKDVAKLRAWIESGAFRVDYVPPSRNFLVFSGGTALLPSPPRFIFGKSMASCISRMPQNCPCHRIWHNG